MSVKFLVLITNDSFNSCVQYFGKISNFLYQFRGHAVAQFPTVSLEFFFAIILLAALWSWG